MSKTIECMVECPKGSAYKLDYQEDDKTFKLTKILPAGLVFPFDFGMIPDTRGEDGDPLDIIVISELSTFPGCRMDVRLIGALQIEQTERDGETVRNDRFIGIPTASQLFPHINEMAELPESIINQIAHFFENYNEQAGKKLMVKARLNSKAVAALI